MPLSKHSANVGFSHAFQPIVDIDEQRIVSYEVLLRGKNQEPPATVFGRVDKADLMDFDQISREKAIALAASLGLDCCLSLNFTPRQILFKNGHYVERTISYAIKHNIQSDRLIVEITESEVIQDIQVFKDILNMLRRAGVAVSIDDFGSGHAGLNLLADIQPDQIKIDMHLIRNIGHDGPRQSIVNAIKNICLDLGIDVLAEGIETREEYLFLAQAGISLYQGYFFARPEFETLPDTFHWVP